MLLTHIFLFFPPFNEFTNLMSMKMDKAAKIFKARFVLNIGEHGEDDPHWHNVIIFILSVAIFQLNLCNAICYTYLISPMACSCK